MEKLNGKLPPQNHANEDVRKAAAYVLHQRKKYKAGTLSPEMQDKLAKIRSWSWDGKPCQWKEGLENLRRCMAANSNKVPTQRSVNDADKQAAIFAMNRRQEYKEGTLSKEMQDMLTKIEAGHGKMLWMHGRKVWKI